MDKALLIDALFKAFCAVVIFVISRVVLPYITEKSKTDKTIALIYDAVRAAEQEIKGNEEKKEWVLNFVTSQLSKLNIDFDFDYINFLIESAVYNVKKENKR